MTAWQLSTLSQHTPSGARPLALLGSLGAGADTEVWMVVVGVGQGWLSS